MVYIPGLKTNPIAVPYDMFEGEKCVAIRLRKDDIFIHLKYKTIPGSIEMGAEQIITYVEEDFHYNKLINVNKADLKSLFDFFDNLVIEEPILRHTEFLVVYRNKKFYLHGIKMAHENFNSASRSETEKWAKIIKMPVLPIYWKGKFERLKLAVFTESTYIQRYESNTKTASQKLIGPA